MQKKFSVKKLQATLERIIYETDTPLGRGYDVVLILSIVTSSGLIIFDSIGSIHEAYGVSIDRLQYVFLIVFTLEYLMRLWTAKKKRHYAFSFYGIVDVMAILPFYLWYFLPGGRVFLIIRVFRLLRLFTVFKMGRYIHESNRLLGALKRSSTKIAVFLITILFIVIFVGAFMYILEGPEHGFKSIPEAMYWAVVTISTVGYGDLSPQTTAGKLLSSALMLVGYGIIAVPTGIITSEMMQNSKDSTQSSSCPRCDAKGHVKNARYCFRCGESMFK